MYATSLVMPCHNRAHDLARVLRVSKLGYIALVASGAISDLRFIG